MRQCPGAGIQQGSHHEIDKQLAIGQFHHPHIIRGFNHTDYALAHALHPMRRRMHGTQNGALIRACHDAVCMRG